MAYAAHVVRSPHVAIPGNGVPTAGIQAAAANAIISVAGATAHNKSDDIFITLQNIQRNIHVLV